MTWVVSNLCGNVVLHLHDLLSEGLVGTLHVGQ